MTAVALDSRREQLLALLRSERAYEFLHQVDGYLVAAPDDQLLRIMAIREYVKLGLIEPARELIPGATAADSACGEIRELAARLRRLPDGRVDWSARRSLLERNLATLFDATQRAAIQAACADQERFEALPVEDFMASWARAS